MDLEKWVKDNLIHSIVAGSHLYGMARPDSDVDIRGVCRMPKETLLGLTRFEQYQSQADEDIVIYGLSKFVQLSLDANPNILDILFAPPDVWMLHIEEWEEVYANRHLFLSQKIRYTFSGYAVSQLKRIKGHRRWLTDPPAQHPIPADFRGHIEQGTKGEQILLFPNFSFQAQYNAKMKEWKDYQRWLKERNPKRAELERKFGYDTKHAAHLVRLMTQATNILDQCDYNPVLSPVDRLVVTHVLEGGWTYDKLVSWAEDKDEQVRAMPTHLPKRPPFAAVQELLIKLNVKSLEVMNE